MLFNIDNCKVMHLSKLCLNYVKAKYEMNGKYLEEVIEERDLGVIIQSDLKCSKQSLKAVSMANKVLGMIKRSFSIREREIIFQLKTLGHKQHNCCCDALALLGTKMILSMSSITLCIETGCLTNNKRG